MAARGYEGTMRTPARLRRLVATLLATAVLAACKPETAPPKPKASAPVRPRASAPAKAQPTADPAAPVPVPRAEGPFTTLAGTVRLEARHLVDLGLAAPSGEAVALTGAGRLLSDVGGGILALQAPGLITDNGAGLLSDAGGGLVSDAGGGLVANNSAGVIGQNGAAYHLNGAGYQLNGAAYHLPTALLGAPRFGLAQAGAAGLAPGELRAVAGAVVIPIDPRTGRPVGTVTRSDAAGGFAAEVPARLAGNVLFAVRVPAERRDQPAFTDPRLRPNLLAGVGAQAPRAADEDTALVTRYLQACFVSRLEAAIGEAGAPDEAGADGVAERLAGARLIVPELKAVLLALVTELREAARASGADRLPRERRLALARRMAHRILARLDLEGVMIDPTFAPKYPGPAEPAHAAMVDVLRQMREATSARLAADPAAFDAKPYLVGTDAKIRRGADLPDFCVNAYLIPDDPQGLEKNGQVLADLGFAIETGGVDLKSRLAAAMYSMVGALAQALILDADAKEDAFAVVRDARP